MWLAPQEWGLQGSQTTQGHSHWLAAEGAEHQNDPLELSIQAACKSNDQTLHVSLEQIR